ncbi:MAG: winged helix-turn-helix domain-containing protein [Candidatus Acidiferrales bacterium]
MAEARGGSRNFRFGTFEIDESTGELRKEGKAQPRLRDQALRILLMLLERPRDLVTREELREQLWSSDTFVDFDHGLNTAINQLRNALGDSAGNPRFIQTLPRRGYRFIAPVEIAAEPGAQFSAAIPSGESNAPLASTADSAEPFAAAPRSSVLSDPRDLPVVSSGIVRTLFSLIQLIYLVFYVVSLARLSKVDAILSEARDPVHLILTVLIVTAAAGIPTRLYLLAAAAFNYRGLNAKFRKLFPFLLPLDELWALAPFLLVQQIGIGLAIAATAALLYLPFSQRSLLLMAFSARN